MRLANCELGNRLFWVPIGFFFVRPVWVPRALIIRNPHSASAFRIPIRADPLNLTRAIARAAFFPISHFDFDFDIPIS